MMKRKNNNKWRNHQRYKNYYNKIMKPIRENYYKDYIRRIRKLRKKVLSLGKIPSKREQIISTLKYLTEIVKLSTDFVDKGMINWEPDKNAESIKHFNEIIITLTFREGVEPLILNKTPKGGNVTFENLYIGVASKIDNNIQDYKKIKEINKQKYSIEVETTSISDWINRKATTVNGFGVDLNQKKIAKMIEILLEELIIAIDEVLKDE